MSDEDKTVTELNHVLAVAHALREAASARREVENARLALDARRADLRAAEEAAYQAKVRLRQFYGDPTVVKAAE